jgi:hypothetical protein
MSTRAKLESQIKSVRTRLKVQTKKQIEALRSKAAAAALQWVISHQGRVDAFRASVKGTPVEKALDNLIEILKVNSGHAAKIRPSAKKKVAAKKKAPAKKAVKKAAVKKTVKKTAKKAARRR